MRTQRTLRWGIALTTVLGCVFTTNGWCALSDVPANAAATAAAPETTSGREPDAAANAMPVNQLPAAQVVDKRANIDAAPLAAAKPSTSSGVQRATTAGDIDAAALTSLLGDDAQGYNKLVRCISTVQVDETEVLSPTLIVFSDRHHIWLNQLASVCPGLQPNAKIALQSERARRFCSFDSVSVLNYFSSGGDDVLSSFGPGCFLGKFEPISKAQLAVLREHFTPPPPTVDEHQAKRDSKSKQL